MEYKIKKNGFLTVVLSFLPGGGHMYLGLMRQGLELMAVFFIIAFLSAFLEIGPLMILYPILAFYAIFDALQKRASDYDDKEAHCDIYYWITNRKTKFQFKFNQRIVGIVLVIIGAIVLFNNFLPYFFYAIGIERYYTVVNMLRTILLALCFIGGGLWLAFRKPKNNDPMVHPQLPYHTENTENHTEGDENE